MLTEVRFTSQPGGGGKIEFDGLVKKLDTVKEVESQLRDATHQVLSWSDVGRMLILPSQLEPLQPDFVSVTNPGFFYALTSSPCFPTAFTSQLDVVAAVIRDQQCASLGVLVE